MRDLTENPPTKQGALMLVLDEAIPKSERTQVFADMRCLRWELERLERDLAAAIEGEEWADADGLDDEVRATTRRLARAERKAFAINELELAHARHD